MRTPGQAGHSIFCAAFAFPASQDSVFEGFLRNGTAVVERDSGVPLIP
jgi:hypothetical protein